MLRAAAAPLSSAPDHALEACGLCGTLLSLAAFPLLTFKKESIKYTELESWALCIFLGNKIEGPLQGISFLIFVVFPSLFEEPLGELTARLAMPIALGNSADSGQQWAGSGKPLSVSLAGNDYGLGALDTVYRPPSSPVKEKCPGRCNEM